MRSLKTTLGVGLGVSLIALVLLQWWLVSATFREITENYLMTRLQRDVDMLLGSLQFTPDGEAYLQIDQQTYFDDRPFSGHYYQISVAGRTLRSHTLWDQRLDVEPATVGEQREQRLVGPLDQRLLALTQGYSKRGHTVSITVAEDISAILAEIAGFQTRYLLISGALLLLLLLLQQFLMRQTLAPLKGVQLDLQRLERGEIRSVRETVPQELLPLVREVNRLLGLLHQRVERSRHMVGNLAHALKTPLSVLRQIGQSGALENRPAVRAQVLDQVQTIHQRLERELNRARLAGDHTSGARFDPGADLPALMAMLEQAYDARGIRLSLHQNHDGSWPAEREDMLELAGNLIDNACKWARSRVVVTVAAGPEIGLIVEDDGPGCPPELRDLLGRRGQRLDERPDGHGLGLAIARDIVDHYEGELSFSESALGGLRVMVTLKK